MADHTTTSSRTWPRLFLKDFERTGTALWLYLFLLTRANPRTGCFRDSPKRVAQELGVSMPALQQWVEQLEQEGYVRDESLNGVMVVWVDEKVPHLGETTI